MITPIKSSVVLTSCLELENELNPKYLNALFNSHRFLDYVDEKAAGGVRMNFKFEYMEDWEIPLPDIDEQAEIVEQIEKQKAIIEGADLILKNWGIDKNDFILPDTEYQFESINSFAKVGTGSTPSRSVDEYFNGEINWVLTGEISMNKILDTSEKLTELAIKDYGLTIYPKNTVLIAMYGQGKTRGQSSLLKIPAAITQNSAGIICDENEMNPDYLWYYLMSIYDIIRGQDYSGAGVPHLNLKIIRSIRVPKPKLQIQAEIVKLIEKKLDTVNSLSQFIEVSKKHMKLIVDNLWSLNPVEK